MASAAEAGPQQSGSGKPNARVPPAFEYSKFSLHLPMGRKDSCLRTPIGVPRPTGAAVPGGPWRIDWPRTKLRDMPR
jgi:hypothetical protein